MRLTFWGAAGEVTGSQHLIETDQLRVLLDCGSVQGAPENARLRNERFPFKPKEIDVVLLSHAHIDHCGNLPRLWQRGYRGPILMTAATASLAELMLHDSARIQAEDAESDPSGRKPLYTENEVREVVKRFEPFPSGESNAVFDDFRLNFHPSGHILGSVISEMEIRDGSDWKTVIYTGDVGHRFPFASRPAMLPDPGTSFEHADAVICESTYGNAAHAPIDELLRRLTEMLKQIAATDGCLLIPAFSLGRTQQLLYLLKGLEATGDLPPVPIYLDSPLGTRINAVYRDYLSELSEGARSVLSDEDDPFALPNLTTIRSRKESRELNAERGPLVIISASGMCNGGRIVHHLRHRLEQETTTVLMMGYQAEGTTGRALADGAKTASVLGHTLDVKANIVSLSGLSAHADLEDFLWWFEALGEIGGPNETFLVHGEDAARENMAKIIAPLCNSDPILPRYGESFEI